MGTFKVKGLRELEVRVGALRADLRESVIGPGLYAGADVMADAFRQGIEALPTAGGFGSQEHPLAGPSRAQKEALAESLGITPMQKGEKGVYNIKIGFDGYNRVRTKRWPNGQPNQMIARAVESGTTFMRANSFMKKAVSKHRRAALEKMKQTMEEKIEEIMQ